MILRRLLLVALVILCACATPLHGYLWKYDATQPACEQVVWHQVTRSQIPGLCSSRGYAASPGTSCSLGCVVVSQYSEAEAKGRDLWGESLYAHESRHVMEKKVHPNE